jgi:hypothetical protein
VCRRSSLLTGEGGRGGGGAKSYDHAKAWPFINHSIFSELNVEEKQTNVLISTVIGRYYSIVVSEICTVQLLQGGGGRMWGGSVER